MQTTKSIQIVPSDKEFRFKGLCPYCKSDLIYEVHGWIEDEEGRWEANEVESHCVSMPHFDDPKWEEWMNQHSFMPYEYQLPVDQAVITWLQKRYRFTLK